MKAAKRTMGGRTVEAGAPLIHKVPTLVSPSGWLQPAGPLCRHLDLAATWADIPTSANAVTRAWVVGGGWWVVVRLTMKRGGGWEDCRGGCVCACID